MPSFKEQLKEQSTFFKEVSKAATIDTETMMGKIAGTTTLLISSSVGMFNIVGSPISLLFSTCWHPIRRAIRCCCLFNDD